MLHTNNNNNLETTLVSSEVQSKDLVCSNTSLLSDCTSLGISEIKEKEELLLDTLADLLVDIYLYAKRKGN